jgi:hypothetical protein
VPVCVERAIWNRYRWGDHFVDSPCVYTLEYSAIRNRYRVRCSGWKPKKHTYYGVAMQRFERYIKQNSK